MAFDVEKELKLFWLAGIIVLIFYGLWLFISYESYYATLGGRIYFSPVAGTFRNSVSNCAPYYESLGLAGSGVTPFQFVPPAGGLGSPPSGGAPFLPVHGGFADWYRYFQFARPTRPLSLPTVRRAVVPRQHNPVLPGSLAAASGYRSRFSWRFA